MEFRLISFLHFVVVGVQGRFRIRIDVLLERGGLLLRLRFHRLELVAFCILDGFVLRGLVGVSH